MRRERDRSKEVVASVKDRVGRRVVLERGRWEDHILKHVDRDLDGRELAVMRVVENPDKRKDGNQPGTQVLFKEGLGPARWLAVVVEYHGLEGRVRTAYPLSEEPKTER